MTCAQERQVPEPNPSSLAVCDIKVDEASAVKIRLWLSSAENKTIEHVPEKDSRLSNMIEPATLFGMTVITKESAKAEYATVNATAANIARAIPPRY